MSRLSTAVQISEMEDSLVLLLAPPRPGEVVPDGEWEAWAFAAWLPGAEAYSSFRELMLSFVADANDDWLRASKV